MAMCTFVTGVSLHVDREAYMFCPRRYARLSRVRRPRCRRIYAAVVAVFCR